MSRKPTAGDRLAKRALDMVLAGAGLVVLSPVLAAGALAVRASMGSPVLYTQRRPGLNEEPFTIYKLRTMREPTEEEARLESDAQRVTAVGRFLRRTSIDELPELWNVVKGDMSLVGPRPLLMSYLERYTPEQRRRHHVPPGITGLAQINGRQNIPFSRRLELDVEYVDNWSLALDLKILALTVVEVLRGVGVKSGQSIAEVDDLGLYQRSDAEEQP